jgi:hypothetical protein
VVVDNAKALVLAHTRASTVWHPTYADFAAHHGFRPWACWPRTAAPLPAPDQGQGRVGGEVRAAERARRQTLRLVGAPERVAARVGHDRRRPARARDHARDPGRALRHGGAHARRHAPGVPARARAAPRGGERRAGEYRGRPVLAGTASRCRRATSGPR